MRQLRQQQHQSQRIFTASEVAEFEYCPLAWWHAHFEPAAQADTEELFARLVELEHEHDAQAPALPEYQMVEQLLLRRGAFDEEGEPPPQPDDEIAEIAQEHITTGGTGNLMRRMVAIALVMLVLGALLMVASFFLAGR